MVHCSINSECCEAAKYPRYLAPWEGTLVQGTKARWIMPATMPAGYAAPLKHLSPVVAQILYNRGIPDDELAAFLRPEVAAMHSPSLMYGMDEAVRRLRHAIAEGEKIAVYGDFDVDGITGTVLLWQILSILGAEVMYYVPHRTSEGYGLNTGALDRLHAADVRLVVTVDCGISCIEEVEYARGLGIDVVITDHHLPPTSYPPLSPSLIRISRAAPTHLRSCAASASPSS